MIGLTHYLAVSAILFVTGVFGIFLNRKNLIIILMAIELILLSVNLNLVAFSAYLHDLVGQVFAMFVLTVAAGEAAIGLAILVIYFRGRGTIAASSGRKTMKRITPRSALHPIDVVDRDRAAPTEIDHQDRQPDGRLTRRDGQHEHREHLAHQVVEVGGKGDQVQVHREQDQLDRHQHDDQVLAVRDQPQHAEREQDGGNDEIVDEADHSSTPAPTG